MRAQSIVCGNTSAALKSSPINPKWIIEGEPVARNAELSRSSDGTSSTLVWDCTPGRFEWHYDVDETIHILEGAVVLDDGVSAPRRLGPGDVVLFPAGAVVRWTVETHVRKLAFFRRPLPRAIALAAKAVRAAKRALRRAPPAQEATGPMTSPPPRVQRVEI